MYSPGLCIAETLLSPLKIKIHAPSHRLSPGPNPQGIGCSKHPLDSNSCALCACYLPFSFFFVPAFWLCPPTRPCKAIPTHPDSPRARTARALDHLAVKSHRSRRQIQTNNSRKENPERDKVRERKIKQRRRIREDKRNEEPLDGKFCNPCRSQSALCTRRVFASPENYCSR